MAAHILRGTKQEIAETLARIPGEVREAIVFVDDPAASESPATWADDVFAEMQPYMVDGPEVDDSRESIYSCQDGE
jgi:hypothetical protein